MVTLYLLDTDTVIDLLKGMPPAAKFINRLYQGGDVLCTCDVIVAEVYAGLRAPDRERGRTLLGSMRFLSTSLPAARQAGLWRYEFARRGRQLSTADCLIAAVALNRKATLVTGNLSDFPMPEISILPLPRPR